MEEVFDNKKIGYKEGLKKTINFLKKSKVQWAIIAVLFLIILISSTSMRLSNLPNLVDSTTGEYTSQDLDSLYFYRQAETQLNLGYLPEVDEMRSPQREVGWVSEIIDNALVWNYKMLKIFSPGITFNYSATISAPIFNIFLLIAFFLLCFLLTKSKIASLISTIILAYAPMFLFRSIAGFYDHDQIGVFAIILLLIGLVFALRKFEGNWKKTIAYGALMGFLTALVFVSWGGAITFVLVCLPLAFLFYFLLNNEKKEKFLVFYVLFILGSILFTSILGGYAKDMIIRLTDSQGILVLFVFLFSFVDYILIKFKNKFKFIKEKNEKLYSFIFTIILGLIGLILMGKNPINLFNKAWATLIYPFFGEFGGRLSATVAENAQPYLNDLIGQTGKIIFWFFLLGLLFLAFDFSKNIHGMKKRILMRFSIIILFLAILCSRISSTSLLNGENFISQTFYFLGGVFFICVFAYVYSKGKFKVSVESITLFAVAITVAMNARAAIRSFFLIAPFIFLFAGYFVIRMFSITKKSKDDTFKYILIISSGIIFVLLLVSFFGNPLGDTPGIYKTASTQAEYIGASANSQWQNAMAWVRESTGEGDIFVHWWDYGYFVQTLGKRPTVTDGGHSGGDNTDHYIGRYLLTTSNTETAYSFMKTWNVSYLLIDPTEMGKYGAFSKIGSNDSWDRISTGIFGGASDEKQTQETSKGVMKVYPLSNCVDGDIFYEYNETNVFLPGISVTKTQQIECHSYIIGVIVEFKNEGEEVKMSQPEAVFVYNNKQYRIPIKNVYMDGKFSSFEEGIDSVLSLIPAVNTETGKIDQTGAVIYLSPRTFNSLMGRLYILNDPFGEYSDLTLANKQDDPAVDYFNQFTGGKLNEFIWYQGLRAPLKIWKVDYPEDTPIYGEFLDHQIFLEKGFGGLDYLFYSF